MRHTVPPLCLRVTSEPDLLTKRLAQLILKKKKEKTRSFFKTTPLYCVGVQVFWLHRPQLFLGKAESALLVGLIRKALISFALCIVEVSGWL